jgi:hypothetical protein
MIPALLELTFSRVPTVRLGIKVDMSRDVELLWFTKLHFPLWQYNHKTPDVPHSGSMV